MTISTPSDLSNRRPYEAHHIRIFFPPFCVNYLPNFDIAVFSDTNIGAIPSSPKSNAPLCEESDISFDEDVEFNQDRSKLVFPSGVLTSHPDDPGDESQLNSPLEGSTSTLHVRFRPRVRITSGLNRHRRRRPMMENHQDYFTFTPTSSSGSPSSSISAPLRTPLDDEVGKPGWGPLGRRVALLAKRHYPGETTRHQPEGLMANGNVDIGTEQTPLLNPSLRFLLSRDSHLRYLYHNGSDEEISRWIDRAFGTWPSRLLNHHWWQWKLEPLMACQCPIDCDDEGYS